MKIAFLTTDSREHFGDYCNPVPYFGTAPQGLISGFSTVSRPAMVDDECVPPANSQLQSPSCSNSIEIHVISCARKQMESPEKLADNIWFHSLHVSKWGWLKTGYLGCILAVRKKLREIQPDLVHAQGTERDCAISAIFTPFPKLLTIHGNLRMIKRTVGFRPGSPLWVQSFVEGFVIPKFDGIICITNYTRAAVQHEARRTWVLPNAVDPTFLELGEKRAIQKSESVLGHEPGTASNSLRSSARPPSSRNPYALPPTILVVANVDARKNQTAFICALDALAREVPFCVKFFGRCGEDEYGRNFLDHVAARPWCEYGGMVGRKQLRDQFAQASILALPTHEDNCPMVVLEAQAAGIPVIASNVGGVPDLVEDGVSGLLTDPKRIETMSVAIKRLLEDPELAARLAKTGREQAMQRYHPDAIARRHIEIYREILSR